ncbi:unnamed protein product [Phytomonas sp. EM1]|nr:unnamed protein product [Phytomonas sp. EM1]|eukprot:CCW60626.1 unnamed protein product [Phytomonas sp. isolate EM1]
MLQSKAFLWQDENPKAFNEASWNNKLDSTLNKLSEIYKEVVEPVENQYMYKSFKRASFEESIKQKLPFVTFLGPFSSGKSTVINYLIQHDVLVTGPQPVTDKFTIISYGEKMDQIPGKVLIDNPNSPFHGLSQFGESFSDHFTSVLAPHPLLRSFTLIDTPGVLEASVQNHSRQYSYADVARWFVEKSDLVILLFDPTKLETGMELQSIFNTSLKGFHGKVRIILNKADSVQPRELIRVYGALFWNLSNLIHSTEPPRVYLCSLWNQPYAPDTDHELFESEKVDFLYELFEKVPMQTLNTRVTSTIRRARSVLVFSMICASYRSRIPLLIGKSKAKKSFFNNYSDLVKNMALDLSLAVSDFPTREEISEFLERVDSSSFPNFEKLEKSKSISRLKKVINTDLPNLFQTIKQHSMCDPRDRRKNLVNLLAYNTGAATKEETPVKAIPIGGGRRNPLVVIMEEEDSRPQTIEPV